MFRNTIFGFLVFTYVAAFSQGRKPAVMAPVYDDGYFVTLMNDTVAARIQTNTGSEADFYNSFYYTSSKVRKPRLMTAQKVKAYGFGGRSFVVMEVSGEKRFVERLVTGRLRLYEFRYAGRADGNHAILSDYYVKDTYAEGEDKDLSRPRRMSGKFYKRFLKPYMKDQPVIWGSLDKFTFDRNSLIAALREFNSYYRPAGL
jgi:hypothetical protein